MKQRVSKEVFNAWLAKHELLTRVEISDGEMGRIITYHRLFDDQVVATAARGKDPMQGMEYHLVNGGRCIA